jgi:hypothetical protein
MPQGTLHLSAPESHQDLQEHMGESPSEPPPGSLLWVCGRVRSGGETGKDSGGADVLHGKSLKTLVKLGRRRDNCTIRKADESPGYIRRPLFSRW